MKTITVCCRSLPLDKLSCISFSDFKEGWHFYLTVHHFFHCKQSQVAPSWYLPSACFLLLSYCGKHWQQHKRHCHPDTDVKFRGSSMTLEFYHDSLWVLKLNKFKEQRPGSGIYYLELMDVKKEWPKGNVNSTAFRPIFNSSASLWKPKWMY